MGLNSFLGLRFILTATISSLGLETQDFKAFGFVEEKAHVQRSTEKMGEGARSTRSREARWTAM